jgi:hypothetical protein
LGRGPFARRAEGLAGRATGEKVDLTGVETGGIKDRLGRKVGYVAFKDFQVGVETACLVVCPDGVAKSVFLFGAGDHTKPARLFKT